MADVTTIKVPRTLRERISRGASRRGVTSAALLGELLDRYERDQRLATVGEAYAKARDEGYADEVARWDETSADGLA